MAPSLTIEGNEITFVNIKRANQLLKTLANPYSQSILKLLALQEEFNVTEICFRLRIAQPVASSHLYQLKQYDLVCIKRRGKYNFYNLNCQKLKMIGNILSGDCSIVPS